MAEKGFGVKEINLIGASGTPTIESPNNLNLNAVNVAISTNVSIGGTLTVTGNVSVGGTLTYEDVTNIDSVGIVTAREGIFISENKELKLGNTSASPDFKIYNDSGSSYVHSTQAGAYLRIKSAGGIVMQQGTSQNCFFAAQSGKTSLYYAGSEKIETTNTGVTVTGTVVATTFSGSGASLTGIAVTEAPVTDYTISANGSSAYLIHGGGVDETANSPDLYLIRGQKYRFNNTTGSGHPFALRVSNGGSAYTDGVSGSNQGIQFFTVPYAAPASLVYQCTIHGGMVGNIYIRGGSSTANISNNADNRVITGGSGGNLNGESTLTYDGSGNLGVSNSSGSVAITVTTANNTDGGIYFTDGADGNKGAVSYLHTDDSMKFRVNGTNKLIIDSSGNVEVTGSVTASAPVAWYGEQDTTQNVSNASWTTVINLGNNPVNTTGWNESTGIFTVPSGQAGAYMLTGGAGIDDLQSTDWIQVGFSVNDGVPTVWSRKRAYTPVSGQIFDNNLSNIKNLNVGDTVKLQLYHSEGTVEPTEADRCWFGGHRIN